MTTLRDLLISLQSTYFVNRQDLIDVFTKSIKTDSSLRLYHFLIIFGPGGIGKTMLLGEFRDICAQHDIASSLISMDTHYSPIDILISFREDFEPKPGSKVFQEFDKLISKYNDLQQKLIMKEQASGKISEVLGSVLGVASATALGGAITGLSLGPIGALLGAAGGILTKEVLASTTTALLNNGLITRNEVSFLNTLLPELTSTFVRGIDRFTGTRDAIVLMLDTYEYAQKTSQLDNWITAQLLPNFTEKTIVVISGRNPMEGKFWQTYSSLVYQRRLEPFTESDLIKYLKVRGVDPDQINVLLDLTAGLPLSAALWADLELQEKQGLSQIGIGQRAAEVLNKVVDRLLETIDEPTRAVIRACAIPRFFDEPILDLLLPGKESTILFENLRKFSSIFQVRSNGLSMHNEVRKSLLQDFKNRNRDQYNELNLNMGNYYLEKAGNQRAYNTLWFDYKIEQAYHLLAADSQDGLRLLLNIVRDARAMFSAGIVEVLEKVVSNLPADKTDYLNSYLDAELAFLGRDYPRAKEMCLKILETELPSEIKAEVIASLCSTSWFLGEYQNAHKYVTEALELSDPFKNPTAFFRFNERLGWINASLGNYMEAISHEKRAFDVAVEMKDDLRKAWALDGMGWGYLQQGNISHSEQLFTQSLLIFTDLHNTGGRFYSQYHLGEIYAETGRFDAAETYYQEALKTWPDCDDQVLVLIRLGQLRGLQGKFEQAIDLLESYKRQCQEKSKPYFEARTDIYLGEIFLQEKDWEKAKEHFENGMIISQRIGSRYIEAKSFLGVLKTYCLQNMAFEIIEEAAVRTIALAKEFQYHDVLAEGYLYRDLAKLGKDSDHFHEGSSLSGRVSQDLGESFLKALIEGLKYNSYFLDHLLHQLVYHLQPYDPILTRETLKELEDLWLSGKLKGESLLSLDRKLRERDGLPDHQVLINEQLISYQDKGGKQS